jgi:hypothetical protein
MRRAILLVAVGVTVLALFVGAALATPPSGQTSTLITRATLGKFEEQNQGIEVESQRRSADLAIVRVVLEPGGSTGWHHHPGVGLAAVDRPPFFVPVTMGVLAHIVASSSLLLLQDPGAGADGDPQTPQASGNPAPHAVYGDCSVGGSPRPILSPP